jgi:hypothetical protein
MRDKETDTLLKCMQMLNDLRPDARTRVMRYLNERFNSESEPMGMPEDETEMRESGASSSAAGGSSRRSNRKSRSNDELRVVQDLVLDPPDKISLREFFEKVNPKRNGEKEVTFIYYLKRILGIEQVTLDHVFTCFYELSQPLPKQLYTSLLQVSSSDKYFSTADVDDLTLRQEGEQYIQQQLGEELKTLTHA